MNIKEKWQERKAERRYLSALRAEGKARVKFLESVNDLQKFNGFDPWCIDGYPDMIPMCNYFQEGIKCEHKTCPMCSLNHDYVDAAKVLEEARLARYQAQTALIAAKVKE